MKTVKLISFVVIVGLAFSLLLSSCEINPEVKPQEDILPSSFRVAVPSSISNSDAAGGRKLSGRIAEDSVRGNDIYINLATFIAVGDGAGKIVEDIIRGIRIYHIDKVKTLTFVSDDDHRTKNLVVLSEVSYENQTWDYQLTITDADSEGEADGGNGLQVFWNKSSPIKGIAILNPYNLDRVKNANVPDAMFRIDYSEAGDFGYDATMEVAISGLPLGNPLEQPFAINTLKMFVGKKGDVVDVYGNSNHPNAILFSGTVGFNWAFVASGSDSKNIAVAEVGLPPNTLDTDDREVLLKEYSIKNVLTTEITAVWPQINPNTLEAYLSATAAPGYFNAAGFLAGGVSPGADFDLFANRLEDLSPYNPKTTNDLVLTFK